MLKLVCFVAVFLGKVSFLVLAAEAPSKSSENIWNLFQDGHNHQRVRRDHYSLPSRTKNHLILDYGWSPRQLTSFSNPAKLHSLGSSQVPSTEYVYPDGVTPVVASDEDNLIAAGHSHGWGWGHGGGHGKGCNSALGLLGILGLASYLQNVLRQMNGFGLGGGGAGGGGAGGGAGGGGAGGGGGAIGGGRSLGGRGRRSFPHEAEDPTTAAIILPLLQGENQQMFKLKDFDLFKSCSLYTVCMLARSTKGENLSPLVEPFLQNAVKGPFEEQKRKFMTNQSQIEWAIKIGWEETDSCEKYFKKC